MTAYSVAAADVNSMTCTEQEEARRKNMLFNILPDKGFKATYIPIDTDCLQVILLAVLQPVPR